MDNVGGYSSHGVRWPEREFNPSIPPKTEVQKKFTLRVCLYGVKSENFSVS
jgi:hypothetical protein